MTTASLVLVGIGELVTNDERRPGLLGLVRDAAVAVVDGAVAWVGEERDLPQRHRDLPALDVEGRAALPGFVDPHTHLVFAGDRADEFVRRLEGERYEDTLAAGGGIHATVRATRAADRDTLIAGTAERARRLLAAGTTTAEVKSGYGLDVQTEQRCLEVVRDVDRAEPIDLVPTWLAAHALPPEAAGDRDGFLDMVVEESLPACAPLAAYADVFCDEGVFTVDEARRVLLAARAAGLRPRLHAEELAHTGGARLAAALGAVSADHLAYADADDARALADAGVAAVLLPATTFSLRTRRYAPADALWDAGVTVALGTDCNPGTSYVESMPFVVALACLEMGIAPDRAVWAATRGGALALEMPDRGRLAPGDLGDIVVLDAPSHRHLPYRPGTPLVHMVVKAGRVVAGAGVTSPARTG